MDNRSVTLKDLKNLPTEELLAKFKRHRAFVASFYDYDYDDYYDNVEDFSQEEYVKRKWNNRNWGEYIPLQAWKDELAKREHVPNKLERKKLRQQRAKQKR